MRDISSVMYSLKLMMITTFSLRGCDVIAKAHYDYDFFDPLIRCSRPAIALLHSGVQPSRELFSTITISWSHSSSTGISSSFV